MENAYCDYVKTKGKGTVHERYHDNE